MFDLEQSISEWRRQMFAVRIPTPVPLEELEIHLREEIQRQMESGLGELEAFEIAVRGIGEPKMLRSEFQKSEGTLEQIKKYCSYSVKAQGEGAVLLIFGFVSAPSQVFLDMLRRESLAKTSK